MNRAMLMIVMPAMALELCAATGDQETGRPSPALFTVNQISPYPGAETAQTTHDDRDSVEAGKDHGIVVTSDSRDFCSRLLRVIDEHDNEAVNSIRSLRYEGERLCDEGHVRLGLARLREALIALKGKDHQ
ncbi:hypothetical protein [Acetobacter musti]|nr:hypothetical protein [Acetobacter musti]